MSEMILKLRDLKQLFYLFLILWASNLGCTQIKFLVSYMPKYHTNDLSATDI